MNNWSGSGKIRAAPKISYTQAGSARASFSLEVDRPTGRATDFINIVAWGAEAEDVRDFGEIGEFVEVQGFLQARTFSGSDGKEKRIYEIVAEKIFFPARKMKMIGEEGKNDSKS